MKAKLERVLIPVPTPDQSLVLDSVRKRAVILAGRQSGKTTLAAIKAILTADRGGVVIYAAPIVEQTRAVWKELVKLLSNPISKNLILKHESIRTLTFSGGGSIVCKSAHEPDNLRGDNCDLLILDEYAYMKPDTWERVGQPMLLARNGTAWFISTPKLKNHFYTMYLKALNNEKWDVFHFSSLGNIHLSKEAFDLMTADMNPEDYKQEILAEFVAGEGQVFTIHDDDFYEYKFNQHKDHRLIAGLDWGQKNDYTALSIGCADCSKEIRLFRVKGDDYPTQRERLKTILSEYGTERPVELLAEANSIGLPNIEQLRADGVPVNNFITTNASKAQIVQSLRLAFEQRSWKWIEDDVAWRELEAFEFKMTASGKATYNAPYGINDDTVIARCLMLRQALVGRLNIY